MEDWKAVNKAVKIMEALPENKEKLDLIRCMYWGKNERRLKDAVLDFFIAESTAKRWHGAFVRLVAKCRGFCIGTETEELGNE